MQSKLLSIILLPAMGLANPLTSNLFRRDCSYAPNCDGCGDGLQQYQYQDLVNQIDTTKVYAVPGDSIQNGWTGVAALPDGSPSILWVFTDPSNKCLASSTTGTIDGDLLRSELQALVDTVTATQEACASNNGQYGFELGEGSNCAGAGGP